MKSKKYVGLLAAALSGLLFFGCGVPSEPPLETSYANAQCRASAGRLDAIEETLVRCETDADCPCGARCAAGIACTFDCRDDVEAARCPDGQSCSDRGACVKGDL